MKRILYYSLSIALLCISMLYIEKNFRFGWHLNLEHGIPHITQQRILNKYSKVLHIGDSVTEGHVQDFPLTSFWGNIDTLYSYPSYMRQMEGWESANAGISGSNPKTWYYKSSTIKGRHYDKEYNYSNYDLFIIEFGYNGTIIPNDSNNAFEYYCKIIEDIKYVNDRADILLLIPPIIDQYKPQNANSIIDISQKYNTFLLDLRNSDLNDKQYHSFPKSLNRSKIHMNAKGYFHKAEIIREYLFSISVDDNE